MGARNPKTIIIFLGAFCVWRVFDSTDFFTKELSNPLSFTIGILLLLGVAVGIGISARYKKTKVG